MTTNELDPMVGRRVRAPYHKIEGVVLRWEPLGAALCDVLVRDDAGREWRVAAIALLGVLLAPEARS